MLDSQDSCCPLFLPRERPKQPDEPTPCHAPRNGSDPLVLLRKVAFLVSLFPFPQLAARIPAVAYLFSPTDGSATSTIAPSIINTMRNVVALATVNCARAFICGRMKSWFSLDWRIRRNKDMRYLGNKSIDIVFV